MVFPEYKKLDLSKIDKEILSYWEEHSIFNKSVSNADGNPPYIFYEGPPSANGLPGIIIHGALKNAFLGQLMTDFIGLEGSLKKLSVQYRAMDEPGTPVYAKGNIKKKYTKDDENVLECDIWLEDHQGNKTTPGYAVVTLPNKI